MPDNMTRDITIRYEQLLEDTASNKKINRINPRVHIPSPKGVLPQWKNRMAKYERPRALGLRPTSYEY